jgi:hypothetical protein
MQRQHGTPRVVPSYISVNRPDKRVVHFVTSLVVVCCVFLLSQMCLAGAHRTDRTVAGCKTARARFGFVIYFLNYFVFKIHAFHFSQMQSSLSHIILYNAKNKKIGLNYKSMQITNPY